MKCLIITVFCLQAIYSKPTEDKIKRYAELFPNKDLDNPELGDHFEGDIVLDEEEKAQVGPFNAIVNKNQRWLTKIVPYVFSSEYTSTQVNQLLAGLEDLQTSIMVNGQTCVAFVARSSQSDYITVRKGSGCSSSIGRRGGQQYISMANGCFRHGTIMHEFLHAMGFYHEQSRGDRDDHVFVNFDNIQPGRENNFRKLVNGVSIDHQGTPYDYGSVLHYGAYGFAIDSSVPTIVPLEAGAEIGQRTHMSALDIERVQILYECLNPRDSKYFKHLADVEV